MSEVRTALLSVFHKDGIVEFATQYLTQSGWSFRTTRLPLMSRCFSPIHYPG